MSFLQKKPKYSSEVPAMFQTYIIPLFTSSFGHLRAKACWISSEFSESLYLYGDGEGKQLFLQLFERLTVCSEDPDLPVQVDAVIGSKRQILLFRIENSYLDQAKIYLHSGCNQCVIVNVAVGSFFSILEDEDCHHFEQILPSLLDKFLRLSHEIESDGILSTLESAVDRFSDKIGPYAIGVVSALVEQYWKVSGADALVNSSSGQENLDQYASDALAGHSILSTIGTVLSAVSKSPEMVVEMENILYPILDRFLCEDGIDVLEELLDIITCLTFYSPAISERMWSLFPKMIACVDSWACDYISDFIPALDNYISRGTSTFIQSSDPSYLTLTNRILEKIATGQPEDTFGIDGEAYIGLAEIIMVVLEHCRGLVDNCVGTLLLV